MTDPHEIANVCGIDGIRWMMEKTKNLPIDVYIMNLVNDYLPYKLNNDLRENGYITEINYEEKNMKSQWKIVDEVNPSFVFIIGEDEINNGYVTIKDNKTKEQNKVKI